MHRRALWRLEKTDQVSMSGLQNATDEFAKRDLRALFGGAGVQVSDCHGHPLSQAHSQSTRDILPPRTLLCRQPQIEIKKIASAS
jgi:hypothetical protein